VTTANSSPVSTTTLKSTSTNTNSDPTTNTNTDSSTLTKVDTTTDVTTAKSEPSTTAVNTTTTAEPNTTTTAEPTTTITVPTTPYPLSSTFTWDSDDINPNPFVVVQVEEGYSISVRVLDVVMPDGGFLLIESGDSHKDDATDGRVFANNVTNKAYLFKTTSVYAYCKVNKNSLYNFKLIFERTGEPTTTVSTTSTTEIIWPTTEEGDSAYITVNVSGRTLKEFNKTKVQEAFKGCLVEMATSYCNDQNIKLQEDITNNNVLITDIDPCPYSWPESETCVRIRFKLPIFYEDDGAESGYLLNSEHLEMMWLRYADGQCFRDNNFATYEEPDFDKYITWWAVGISVVIALFIILLWFLKYLNVTIAKYEPSTTATTEPTISTTIDPTTPYPLSSTFTWDRDDIDPNPFVVVQVEEGYSISVRVSDVVMSDGSYLLIEGGDSHEDDATDGRVFVNNVTNKAYLFKTTSVYAYCKINKTNFYKFTLIFEKIGKSTTKVDTTT
ncbi:G8 domain-containing protein -like, partial [Asbolus verrucosus]